MAQDPLRQLAHIVRQARGAKGYSVRGLASNVRKKDGEFIGGSYITDIEKMRGVPSDVVAGQLATLLGLDQENFLALCAKARAARR